MIQLNHRISRGEEGTTVIPSMSQKIGLSSRIEHFKIIIMEGRQYRGGSDEKMRKNWLVREIVVAGLPYLTILHTRERN